MTTKRDEPKVVGFVCARVGHDGAMWLDDSPTVYSTAHEAIEAATEKAKDNQEHWAALRLQLVASATYRSVVDVTWENGAKR